MPIPSHDLSGDLSQALKAMGEQLRSSLRVAVPGINVNPFDLHSISLLTGFLKSPQFLETVQTHPELLPRLFAGLFENNPKSAQANLLDMLVQREYRGEGSLGTLSSDVNKIDLGEGLTSRDDLTLYAGR